MKTYKTTVAAGILLFLFGIGTFVFAAVNHLPTLKLTGIVLGLLGAGAVALAAWEKHRLTKRRETE